ncbi:MAG: HAD family hydrolase [Actinomycetota bacterium]
MLKALLFDLDGTLLPLEFNEFIPGYFAELSRKFSDIFPDGSLPALITASTDAMVFNDGLQSNSDAFWSDFSNRTGKSRQSLEPLFEEFYRSDFSRLGDGVGSWPEAARVLDDAKSAGATMVLATNPVFPRLAVVHRLAWAGIDPSRFDLITDYDNMRYAKPNPEYYRQIASDIAKPPEECLMVGNDAGLDLVPAKSAGMATFMVENDYSVRDDGFTPDFSGRLEDLLELLY